MFTFEKKQSNGFPAPKGVDFRVYVYEHAKTKRVHLIMRMRREAYERAGWFVGDFVIPSYDGSRWRWSRTTDRDKGYMVTSTDKSGGTNVYVKVTSDRETASKVLPEGSVDCRIISSDAREIVAG